MHGLPEKILRLVLAWALCFYPVVPGAVHAAPDLIMEEDEDDAFTAFNDINFSAIVVDPQTGPVNNTTGTSTPENTEDAAEDSPAVEALVPSTGFLHNPDVSSGFLPPADYDPPADTGSPPQTTTATATAGESVDANVIAVGNGAGHTAVNNNDNADDAETSDTSTDVHDTADNTDDAQTDDSSNSSDPFAAENDSVDDAHANDHQGNNSQENTGSENGWFVDPADESVDTDGDGIPDAHDPYPNGEDKIDTDGDGIPDIFDPYPNGEDEISNDGDDWISDDWNFDFDDDVIFGDAIDDADDTHSGDDCDADDWNVDDWPDDVIHGDAFDDVLGDASDDTAEDDTSNDDTAGDDTAGDDTAGDDTAGDDTAGDDNQADDSQADDNQADDNNAGDDATGDDIQADDNQADDMVGGDDVNKDPHTELAVYSLHSTNETSDSARISYFVGGVQGFTGVKILYRRFDQQTFMESGAYSIHSDGSMNVDLTGLDADTMYMVRVKLYNYFTGEELYLSDNIQVLTTAPPFDSQAQFSALEAVDIDENSATINYTITGMADNETLTPRIFYQWNGTTTAVDLPSVSGDGAYSFILDNLTADTEYTIGIRLIDADGETVHNLPVGAVSFTTEPDAQMSINSISIDEITLDSAWVHYNVSDIEDGRIYAVWLHYRASGDDEFISWQTPDTAGINGSQAVWLTNLTAETLYEVYIELRDIETGEAFESTHEWFSTQEISPLPTAFSPVGVAEVTENSAIVEYSVDNLDEHVSEWFSVQYRYRRSTDSDFGPWHNGANNVYGNGLQQLLVEGSLVDPMFADTDYVVEVRFLEPDGTAVADTLNFEFTTEPENIIVEDPAPEIEINSISASNPGSYSIDISFAIANIPQGDTYDVVVEYRRAGFIFFTEVSAGSISVDGNGQISLDGLQADTDYEFRVRLMTHPHTPDGYTEIVHISDLYQFQTAPAEITVQASAVDIQDISHHSALITFDVSGINPDQDFMASIVYHRAGEPDQLVYTLPLTINADGSYSIHLSSLESETDYVFRVEILDTISNNGTFQAVTVHQSADMAFTTDQEPGPLPSNARIPSIGTDNVTADSVTIDYVVDRLRPDEIVYLRAAYKIAGSDDVAYIDLPSISYPGGSRSATLEGLDSSADYEIWIEITDESGDLIDASEVRSIRTLPAVSAVEIYGVSLFSRTNTSMRIEYMVRDITPGEVFNARVYYLKSGSTELLTLELGEVDTNGPKRFDIRDLEADTEYQIQIELYDPNTETTIFQSESEFMTTGIDQTNEDPQGPASPVYLDYDADDESVQITFALSATDYDLLDNSDTLEIIIEELDDTGLHPTGNIRTVIFADFLQSFNIEQIGGNFVFDVPRIFDIDPDTSYSITVQGVGDNHVKFIDTFSLIRAEPQPQPAQQIGMTATAESQSMISLYVQDDEDGLDLNDNLDYTYIIFVNGTEYARGDFSGEITGHNANGAWYGLPVIWGLDADTAYDIQVKIQTTIGEGENEQTIDAYETPVQTVRTLAPGNLNLTVDPNNSAIMRIAVDESEIAGFTGSEIFEILGQRLDANGDPLGDPQVISSGPLGGATYSTDIFGKRTYTIPNIFDFAPGATYILKAEIRKAPNDNTVLFRAPDVGYTAPHHSSASAAPAFIDNDNLATIDPNNLANTGSSDAGDNENLAAIDNENLATIDPNDLANADNSALAAIDIDNFTEIDNAVANTPSEDPANGNLSVLDDEALAAVDQTIIDTPIDTLDVNLSGPVDDPAVAIIPDDTIDPNSIDPADDPAIIIISDDTINPDGIDPADDPTVTVISDDTIAADNPAADEQDGDLQENTDTTTTDQGHVVYNFGDAIVSQGLDLTQLNDSSIQRDPNEPYSLHLRLVTSLILTNETLFSNPQLTVSIFDQSSGEPIEMRRKIDHFRLDRIWDAGSHSIFFTVDGLDPNRNYKALLEVSFDSGMKLQTKYSAYNFFPNIQVSEGERNYPSEETVDRLSLVTDQRMNNGDLVIETDTPIDFSQHNVVYEVMRGEEVIETVSVDSFEYGNNQLNAADKYTNVVSVNLSGYANGDYTFKVRVEDKATGDLLQSVESDVISIIRPLENPADTSNTENVEIIDSGDSTDDTDTALVTDDLAVDGTLAVTEPISTDLDEGIVLISYDPYNPYGVLNTARPFDLTDSVFTPLTYDIFTTHGFNNTDDDDDDEFDPWEYYYGSSE